MDAIKDEYERQIEELEVLENYIALSLRRNDISEDLKAASVLMEETNEILKNVKATMQQNMCELNSQYKEVMERMDNQESFLLTYTLKERQQKITEAKEEEEKAAALHAKHDLSNILGSSTKVHFASTTKSTAQRRLQMGSVSKPNYGLTPMTSNKKLKVPALQINSANFSTPKMTIDDYKNSPYVCRTVNPIPFNFLEFEVQVTPEQFQTIPKYMVGRDSLDELNSFLENVIIPCFNEKYQLIHRKRNSIRNHHDLDLWALYNDQAKYLPGQHFITEGDISRKIKKEVDKRMRARLVMLRHISILKEERVKQTVCFIWRNSRS